MTPKDLVVFLDPQPAPERLAVAARLARRWQAHLIATFVATAPDLGEFAGFASAAVLQELAEAGEARMRAATEQARADFDALTARRGFTAEWRLSQDEDEETLMLHARHAAMAIMGPPARQASQPSRLDRAQKILLGAGRPCLLWPEEWPGDAEAGRRIVVGWNGSREATRSIAAAMPLLLQADVVYLAVAPQARLHGRYGADPGVDMATHLARHGVPVVVDRLDGKDAGAALLRRCAMLDADLLVVGAKAQVRVVDLVLGDATRTLFVQARIPLLLAT